jgi:large subunit ribosomal protein L23
MLFKKKDSNSSSQAKTSLFASKAKKEDAQEKNDERKNMPAVSGVKTKEDVDTSFKTTVAAGKVSGDILRNPRITEKASQVAENNVYTFDVARSANKTTIKAAIKDVYGVTPTAVRIVTVPTKSYMSRRGLQSTSGGGKKAYVQLKKGDSIELV